VEAWRRKVAETLDGPADREGEARGGAGGYGTLAQRSFPPPAPTDNIPVPAWDGEDEQAAARIEASRIISSEGDDEWAAVRQEYSKKAGPLGWAKRLPAHVLIMITVVGVVGAVLCAVIFMAPGKSVHIAAAKSGTQALAAGKPNVPKAAAVVTAKKAAVPPLTGAQKKRG